MPLRGSEQLHRIITLDEAVEEKATSSSKIREADKTHAKISRF